MANNVLVELSSNVLLFLLLFGMAATVQISQMQKQLHNWKALLIGLSLQFFILPFVGFLVTATFRLPSAVGIVLLTICSSPGGTYSNLWCSVYNASLSLSITMTALSSFLSTMMLPLNLFLYTRWTYSAAVLQNLDWTALYVSLIVVMGAITCGMFVSAYHPSFRKSANRLGSIAGLLLITVSVAVSDSNSTAAWDQSLAFYVAVAIPPIVGLISAITLSAKANLEKPECVAVSIESSNQNTGIAQALALSMFTGSDLGLAISVPLYYGVVELFTNTIFCIICWKMGWTKAPPNEHFCKVITTSYEVEDADRDRDHDLPSFEVVMTPKDGECDLIFSQSSSGGAYVVDDTTLRHVSNPQVADEEMMVTEAATESHTTEELDLTISRSSEDREDPPLRCSTMDSAEEVPSTTPSTTKQILGRTISTIRARTAGYTKAPQQRRVSVDETSAVAAAVSVVPRNGKKYETIATSSGLSPTTAQRSTKPISLRQQRVDEGDNDDDVSL
jgi:predicted Na+-dependent transporter